MSLPEGIGNENPEQPVVDGADFNEEVRRTVVEAPDDASELTDPSLLEGTEFDPALATPEAATPVEAPRSSRRIGRFLTAGAAVLAVGAGAIGIMSSGGEEEPSGEAVPEAEANPAPIGEEASPDVQTPEQASTGEINFEALPSETQTGKTISLYEGHTLDSSDPSIIMDDAKYYLNRGFSEGNWGMLAAVNYLGPKESPQHDGLNEDLRGFMAAYLPEDGGSFELTTSEITEVNQSAESIEIVAEGALNATRFDGEQTSYEGPIRFEFVKVEVEVFEEGAVDVREVLQLKTWEQSS